MSRLKPCPDDAARKACLHTAKTKDEKIVLAGLKTRGHMVWGRRQREVEGQPTLNVDAERVILHCKAAAKTARGTQNNVLSFRAEFKPRSIRVRGEPDL